jgi:serine protease AprX
MTINSNTFKISQSLRQANPEADINALAAQVKNDKGLIPVIVQARNGDELQASSDFVSLTGAHKTADLALIDAFAAELTPEAFAKLAEKAPEGVTIHLDERVHALEPVEVSRPETRDPTQPVLEQDNAIPTLGIDKIWEQGYKGQGITIAVIDTGIYPHADFKERIKAFKSWTDGKTEPNDPQGHGTHVAGDAAGNGTLSDGRFKGPAPEADLVGIAVLDKNGSGRLSDIIKGVQWAVEKKDELSIDIINMSLGGPAYDSYLNDPVAQAVGKAVDAGIVAAIAGGNSGPKPSTIGSPGNHPKAFTVGALNDHGTLTRADDDVAPFSSRGPTSFDGLTKPDILSPGVNITAANAPGSALDKAPVPHVGQGYITISGTSMATPIMAGIIATILSANPNLTPAQVKEIFTATADPIAGVDANSQGFGVVDPQEALKRALALKKAPATV